MFNIKLSAFIADSLKLKIYSGSDMESISDSKIKQIAKITSLMNQISTNLANSMYDNYNVRDRGNFI